MEPSSLPVDPAFQPLLNLLSPILLALVPLVMGLTQGALALPGIRRLSDFGFLVAIVIGILVAQGQAILESGAMSFTAAALLQGVILGALAAAGYKGVHEARKLLPEGLGGTGIGALLAVSLLLPIAAGCSDHGFTRYSVAEAGNSLNQGIVGMEECRTDLARDRDRETELQWRAYLQSQADTVAKAKAENRTPEELKRGLDELAVKFRTERLAAIETARERTDKRFMLVQQHFNYVAQILAKLDSLARKEQTYQAQLAEYEKMAEDMARQKFGLPPAPVTLGAVPAPAVVAQPVSQQPVAPSTAAPAP